MNGLRALKNTLALRSIDSFAYRHRGRRPNSGRLERLMSRSLKVGAEKIRTAIGLKMDGLHLAQIPHQVRPGDLHLALIQPALQVHLEPQRQEPGHDVADRGLVPMMEDRSHLERAFCLPESPLHPPQTFICPGHFGSRKIRVVSCSKKSANSSFRL